MRFEVVTLALVKAKVVWDMMLCCFGGIVPGVQKDHELVFDGLSLRMKAPQCVKITKSCLPSHTALYSWSLQYKFALYVSLEPRVWNSVKILYLKHVTGCTDTSSWFGVNFMHLWKSTQVVVPSTELLTVTVFDSEFFILISFSILWFGTEFAWLVLCWCFCLLFICYLKILFFPATVLEWDRRTRNSCRKGTVIHRRNGSGLDIQCIVLCWWYASQNRNYSYGHKSWRPDAQDYTWAWHPEETSWYCCSSYERVIYWKIGFDVCRRSEIEFVAF